MVCRHFMHCWPFVSSPKDSPDKGPVRCSFGIFFVVSWNNCFNCCQSLKKQIYYQLSLLRLKHLDSMMLLLYLCFMFLDECVIMWETKLWNLTHWIICWLKIKSAVQEQHGYNTTVVRFCVNNSLRTHDNIWVQKKCVSFPGANIYIVMPEKATFPGIHHTAFSSTGLQGAAIWPIHWNTSDTLHSYLLTAWNCAPYLLFLTW